MATPSPIGPLIAQAMVRGGWPRWSVIAAVWMLAGLSGGIAPSLVRSVFHLDSGLLNGATGFVAPAVSAVIGLTFARVDRRPAMTIGIYASIAGSVGIIGGVLAGSLPIMILGQAMAGVGFGASFTAALRLIVPLVAIDERAGVVSAIYVVSYVAFGVPIVIEGQLTGPLGEIPAVSLYTGVAILLAVISLIAQLRLKRNTRSVAGPACISPLQASAPSTPKRDDIPA